MNAQRLYVSEESNSEVPSFEVLYQEHRRVVIGAVRMIVGPHDELEDICQNAFIEIYRSLPRFQGRSSITTWMYGVAMRVALQYRRKLGRSRWLKLVKDDLGLEGQSAPHPVPRLESREALRELDSLLTGLSEAKRVVFVLSDIQGCTNVEIAEILGINANTVRSRLHSARQEVLHLQAQRMGKIQ